MLKHMYKNKGKFCFNVNKQNEILYLSFDKLDYAESKYREMSSHFEIVPQSQNKKKKPPKKKRKRKETVKNSKKEPKEKYKRKKFSQCDKWSVLINNEFSCNMCGIIPTSGLEFDHMIPLQYKGPDSICNLQPLCVRCHAVKTQKVDPNILNIIIPSYINQKTFDSIVGQLTIDPIAMHQIKCKIETLQENKLQESILPEIFKKNNKNLKCTKNIINNFYGTVQNFQMFNKNFSKIIDSIENKTVNITNNFHLIECKCTIKCDCDIYY